MPSFEIYFGLNKVEAEIVETTLIGARFRFLNLDLV